jgi:hypothetical protein
VRVHDLTPQCSIAGRLSVVSELCPAGESIPDGQSPFLPDAVVPRGEWRVPTADEFSCLSGVRGIYDESDIFIVPLPRLARVLGVHLPSGGDFDSVQRAVRDVVFARALEESIDDLVPLCIRPEGLVCQGAWANPGGMRLVTHNMDLVPPRRIGLHVDNWDDLPISERAHGRRRLCVNIGMRPRYLVFLRTPISALAAAGKFPCTVPANLSPAILVRAHLGQNLRQLAARIRIDPGEAYIVNADDVIHDGASDTRDVPDVALHFLGHFGPEGSTS